MLKISMKLMMTNCYDDSRAALFGVCLLRLRSRFNCR